MSVSFLRAITLVALTLFSWSAAAAEFVFQTSEGKNPNPEKFMKYQGNTLHIKGPIVFGDYAKLTKIVLANRSNLSQGWLFVGLTSPGGDIVEAIRIAQLLRSLLADVSVVDECLSACFLIWAGSAQRMHSSRIGVHRPYFEPRYFAGLAAEQARARHNELLSAVRSYLHDNSVPGYLIERMFSLPSNDLYILTAEDLSAIGRRPPWYEELLIARCNLDRKKELQPPPPGTPGPRWPQVNPYDLQLSDCAETHAVQDRRQAIEKLSRDSKR